MNNIEAFRNAGANIKLSKFEYEPSRRYVFDSHANMSHVWNSNKVESGRSSDGRMMFNQSIVYSYGHHFAIAMHLNTSEGEITLLNSNGYSSSTGKHKSHVWHAISRTHYSLPDLTDIAESLRSIAYSGVLTGWTANKVIDYIKKHILDASPDALMFLARIMRVQRKMCAYYRTALAARNKAKANAEKRILETQIRDATRAATISDAEFTDWIANNLKNPQWAKGHRETIAETFQRLAREYWRYERTAKQHLGKRALATIKARHKSLRTDSKSWQKRVAQRVALEQFARYKETFKTNLEYVINAGGMAVAPIHYAETLSRLANWFLSARVRPDTRARLITIGTAATHRYNECKREQERERFEKQARDRAAWLAGQSVGYQRFSDENGRALLRVNGDTLETSHGANVPLAHAIKAFPLIKLCRENRRPWQRNGHTLRVGFYQIDSIDIDGNFRAGCHSIGWNEVERIALALGVFTAPAADTSEETGH